MTNTTNLNIALIAQNQAQKEVTANEAFSLIDAILNRGAVHRGTNTPPGSPLAGDLYIIGSSPTGAWAGHANHIAYYNTAWKFIAPNEGMTIWVNDEDAQYSWSGVAWVSTTNSGISALSTVVTANSGTSYAIDLSLGTNFEITLTGNCTFTFTNPPASGKMGQFTLIRKQDATGSRTVAWPASSKWAGGVEPTLTSAANSVDIISFKTTDGGVRWYGRVDGLDVK